MKARSLVFDLFGDYLRSRGGELRLRGLIALMSCFEVPESTVRVVVTRLRDEGWLRSTKSGRETTYLLTDRSWRLLEEGRDRIFDRGSESWDGQWHMVVYSMPEANRSSRDQLRRRLSWLGFGQLAPAVWVSPHDRTARLSVEASAQPGRLHVFRSRSSGADENREVAARAWDLDQLNASYAELLDRYQPRLDRRRLAALSGRDALLERTNLIHDYRLFPFRDPDLPPALLPGNWLGRDARELFAWAHDSLRKPAETYVDQVIAEADPRWGPHCQEVS